MNISVIATAQQAQDIDFSGKTAVVIDVLRATSVITTALDNGAREVIPVQTVEEAQALYAQSDATQTLRGGERNALKIEGFELSNSPLEYKKKAVEGKTVILTTTNGTCAINNVKGADAVVLGCFRNAEAIANHLLGRLPQCDSPTTHPVGLSYHGSRDVVGLSYHGSRDVVGLSYHGSRDVVGLSYHGSRDVVGLSYHGSRDVVGLSYHGSRDIIIVCAGTQGRFSLDDGLCAGMIIELLKQKTEVETDDLGLLLNRFYNESKDNLFGALSGCHHLKRLFMLGFYDDIKFCLETNCVATVPVCREGRIVKM